MTTKYTTGGGRASIERAVRLISGEIADGFDFVLGIGAIPSACGKRALSAVCDIASGFMPKVVTETDSDKAPGVVVEISPNTTVQASEVVAGALAHQATARRV